MKFCKNSAEIPQLGLKIHEMLKKVDVLFTLIYFEWQSKHQDSFPKRSDHDFVHRNLEIQVNQTTRTAVSIYNCRIHRLCQTLSMITTYTFTQHVYLTPVTSYNLFHSIYLHLQSVQLHSVHRPVSLNLVVSLASSSSS